MKFLPRLILSLFLCSNAFGQYQSYNPETAGRVDHGASGATEDFSIAYGGFHTATLDASVTISFSNWGNTTANQLLTIRFLQDATGSRTLTCPAAVVSCPSINPTADSATFVTFETSDGGTTVYAHSDYAPVISSMTTGADDTYSGTIITGHVAAATTAQWETVYMNSSSKWALADCNGSGTYPARGLAVAAAASDAAVSVLVSGKVRNDAWNWTVGGQIYLSGTAGGLTQTAPSASGDKIQQVGYALTADIAYFDFAAGEFLTVP